jgi:tetratricopeptide (TPR) repeat protein
VDNATKRNLKKQDQFVTLTTHGMSWASANRRAAIVSAALLLAVILGVVGGVALYGHRSEQASTALGAAMQVYQTPLASAERQLPPGTKTFASVQERAAAANKAFTNVADKYGMTKDGKVARYFAGLTYIEAGQTQQAEDTLKRVAGSWDHDLAALAKLALAQLYHGTGRDPQAIAEYKELAAGNASTVPAGMAQIKLAELYETEGKTEEAKKIYAQLKDSDKDDKGKPGPIGSLAAAKLNPQTAAGPALQ